MFWGLIMEPGKKYTQTVEKSFHVSNAALDLNTAGQDNVQVLLGFENRNYLLCTLQKNKIIQVQLDLNFQVGDQVSFATNGQGHVHLTGYLVPEDDYFDEDGEEEGEEEEEVPELVPAVTNKKRKSSEKEKLGENKKSKTELLLNEADETDDSDDSDVNLTDLLENEEEAEEEEDDDEEETDDDDDDEEDEEEEDDEEEETTNEVSKPTKKEAAKQNGVVSKKDKLNKQQKSDKSPGKDKQGEKSPKKEKQKGDKTLKRNELQQKSPNKGETTPQKRTVEGGVIVEDLIVGIGAVAKPGKLINVYYEGRLKSNNKLFDSASTGNGFKFRLGKQEVIKAWDVGLTGMKVGGKRRIICPPNMAYGAQGSPPTIPPNSTLIFEVELKKIK